MGPRMEPGLPKMVFGHNLHHMAPFGILEAGFCMVFRCASFCFLAPGTHFGTPGPKFGPGIWKLGPGWPGEVFGPKMWVGKTWFCKGMVSKLEIMGFPATQMDCMVPRRCLGKPVSPKPPLKNGFPRLSPISGNLGRVPLAPCVSPMGPLWAYRAIPTVWGPTPGSFGPLCLLLLGSWDGVLLNYMGDMPCCAVAGHLLLSAMVQ